MFTIATFDKFCCQVYLAGVPEQRGAGGRRQGLEEGGGEWGGGGSYKLIYFKLFVLYPWVQGEEPRLTSWRKTTTEEQPNSSFGEHKREEGEHLRREEGEHLRRESGEQFRRESGSLPTDISGLPPLPSRYTTFSVTSTLTINHE